MDDAERDGPVKRLLAVVAAVASADQAELSRLVPDSRYRERVLRETLSYLPKAGQRWGIEVANGAVTPTRLTGDTRRQINDWFAAASDKTTMTITGRLESINFAKNKVSIFYPVTRKKLTFNYEVDAEDGLIQARRGWVQARGAFLLDDDGQVTGVESVRQIEPLDLSPLWFDAIAAGGASLAISPPLSLDIVLDEETSQLLTVEDLGLNLCIGAETRDELAAEIGRHVAFLWREYAQENPLKLSPAAQQLRERLRQRLREL